MSSTTLPHLNPTSDARSLIVLEKYPLLPLSPTGQPFSVRANERGCPRNFDVGCAYPDGALASIADQATLIWIVSKLAHFNNAGLNMPRIIAFHPAEVLRFIGRPVGGVQLRNLRQSFERLATTMITTNWGFPDEFSFVATLELPSGRSPWTISTPAWLRDQIGTNQIVKIDPTLLRRRGIERRVAGWARVYCSNDDHPQFRLSIRNAHEKAGSRDSLRKFAHALHALAELNPFDGYRLSFTSSDRRGDFLIERPVLPHGPEGSFGPDRTIELPASFWMEEEEAPRIVIEVDL